MPPEMLIHRFHLVDRYQGKYHFFMKSNLRG